MPGQRVNALVPYFKNPIHSDHRFVALETFDDNFSERLTSDPKNNADLYHTYSLMVLQKEGVRGSGYCDRTLRVLLFSPHLCIVREPCGPTLAALQEVQPHCSFTLPVTKRIIRQTLLALDFMHTTTKRTHVGSSLLMLRNRLWRLILMLEGPRCEPSQHPGGLAWTKARGGDKH